MPNTRSPAEIARSQARAKRTILRAIRTAGSDKVSDPPAPTDAEIAEQLASEVDAQLESVATAAPTSELTAVEDFTQINLSASMPLQDEYGSSPEAVSALPHLAHVRGTHPHAYVAHTTHRLDLLDVLRTNEVTLYRSARSSRTPVRYEVAFTTKDQWVHVEANAAGATVSVYATTPTGARSLAHAIIDLALPNPHIEGSTPIRFVHSGPRGPGTTTRPIVTPTWDEISSNYTAATASSLEKLMASGEPASTARLLLMYGPPGTGKTTAIRALTRQWSSWCDTTIVLDPEHLLTDMNYLQDVVLDDPEDGAKNWVLYVIEDADEIITKNAKDRTGQALSRLLNLTDGIVGQGIRALFLITTNESVKELHQAVIRPGRCLAEINVDPLSNAEARAWLSAHQVDPLPRDLKDTATIAELYGYVASMPLKTASAKPARSGQYL